MTQIVHRQLLLVLATLANAPAFADGASNVVSFENGTVLTSFSEDYGGPHGSEWIAMGLIDGTPTMGWSSLQGVIFPYVFEFRLPGRYRIDRLSFDNREVDDTPGRSARGVEVYAQNAGNENLSFVFKGEVSERGLLEVTLDAPFEAEVLQLQITSNWDDADFAELMEFQAFGVEIPTEAPNPDYGGVFETYWGRFYVVGKSDEIRGCYDHDGGTFSGAADGGFLNIEWREDGPQIGKAVMAVTPERDAFNGFWYENGALAGTWSGKRVPDGELPYCAETVFGIRANDQGEPLPNAEAEISSRVERSLDQDGRAVLYGLLFDVDSATIRPDSVDVLEQLESWLRKNPGAVVQIEGHTDSDGDDAYNVDLSLRRAQSVIGWLSERGLPTDSYSSKGFGEMSPVADNATSHGKSLNRRVEVRVGD